jgi:hypothetical protein
MRERTTTNVSDIVKIGTHTNSSTPYNNFEFGLITGTFTGGTSIVVEPLLSGSGTFNGNMGQVNAIRIIEVDSATTVTSTNSSHQPIPPWRGRRSASPRR